MSVGMDDEARIQERSWRASLVCFVLLAGAFVYVLVARYHRPLSIDDPITLERASAPLAVSPDPGAAPVPLTLDDVDHRIDPNTADKWELATLPRIGEVMAQRIIDHREAARAALTTGTTAPGDAAVDPEAGRNAERIVFRTLEDLEAVKGIGPKTLERLAPHLRFPATPALDAPEGNADTDINTDIDPDTDSDTGTDPVRGDKLAPAGA